MGALDDGDVRLAVNLIQDCRLKKIDVIHTLHLEKPEEFVSIVLDFFK